MKTDHENIKGFFVLNSGNTEEHNRNEVLIILINKKQFAELPLCLEKSNIWQKPFVPTILLKNTDMELLIGLLSVMQNLCDWSKNRNQVSWVLSFCLHHKIIFHFKCLPISSPGYNACWSVQYVNETSQCSSKLDKQRKLPLLSLRTSGVAFLGFRTKLNGTNSMKLENSINPPYKTGQSQ